MTSPPARLPGAFNDILKAIDTIHTIIDGLTYEDFVASPSASGATIWNLCVIGEAAAMCLQSDPELRTRPVGHQLRQANDMRNRLIHAYHRFNLETLWNTAMVTLPEFRVMIESLIESP